MGDGLLEGLGYTIAILVGLGLTFGAFVGFAVYLIRRGDVWRYGAAGVPAGDAFEEIAAAFDGPDAERVGEQSGRGAA